MTVTSHSILTANEAASHIKDGDTVSFSGFSPAGAAKVVPRAIISRARDEHGIFIFRQQMEKDE